MQDVFHEGVVLLIAPCVHLPHVNFLRDVALLSEVVNDLVLGHQSEMHWIRRGSPAGVALCSPAPIMGRSPVPFATRSSLAVRHQLFGVVELLVFLPFAAALAGVVAAFAMAARRALGHTRLWCVQGCTWRCETV